jgi:hypothetical protein
MNCISKPINIKKNKYEVGVSSSNEKTDKNTKNIHEYGLKQNSFNPNNASPPSSWNIRLMQRICNANQNTNSIILASSNSVNAQ